METIIAVLSPYLGDLISMTFGKPSAFVVL